MCLGFELPEVSLSVVGGHRLGEQVTLDVVTTQSVKGRELVRMLDAFGNGVEPQGGGDVEDALD